jgi:DNA-directed RNA polymerase subunit RPC12/RpoP
MSFESISKVYKCTHCGKEKKVLVNHDQLPELFERCTEECMWDGFGLKGPVLYSADGEKTGFHKRLFRRVNG